MKKSLIIVVLSVAFSAVLAMAGGLSENDLKMEYIKSMDKIAKLAKGGKLHPITMQGLAEGAAQQARISLGAINLYNQRLNMYGKAFENTITWENIIYKLEEILSEQDNRKDLFMEAYKIFSLRLDPNVDKFTTKFMLVDFVLKDDSITESKAAAAINLLSFWLHGKYKENAVRNLVMYYLYLNGNKKAEKYLAKKGYFEHWQKVYNLIDKFEKEAKK